MRSICLALALSATTACVPGTSDPLSDVEQISDVELADDGEAVAIAARPRAGGLLSALMGNAGSDEVASGDVPPLARLAFGEVGRTCGLSQSEFGTRVADVSGYQVYDTFPKSTAPRPHYLTGFSDNCARQFTAALVLTGDVGTHEVVRYQGSGRNLPYTSTDEAYEQIKAQFCGVSRGQPCGRRLDALARRTTFVTAYERFDSSPVWADILLHNGDFVAVSVETR